MIIFINDVWYGFRFYYVLKVRNRFLGEVIYLVLYNV